MKKIFFLLPLVYLFVGSNLSLADDFRREVTVQGSCEKRTAPDRASVIATADARADTLGKASKSAMETYEKLRDRVKKLSFENLELQTTENTVQEVRQWENNREVFKGFRARIGLWISTSSIPKLGEVMALASELGVKEVSSLQTYLSQEKARQEYRDCLETASQDARGKAERLAKTLGATLGEVLTIREEIVGNTPRPEVFAMSHAKVMMADAANGGAPVIETAKQAMSVNVNASFALK